MVEQQNIFKKTIPGNIVRTNNIVYVHRLLDENKIELFTIPSNKIVLVLNKKENGDYIFFFENKKYIYNPNVFRKLCPWQPFQVIA